MTFRTHILAAAIVLDPLLGVTFCVVFVLVHALVEEMIEAREPVT